QHGAARASGTACGTHATKQSITPAWKRLSSLLQARARTLRRGIGVRCRAGMEAARGLKGLSQFLQRILCRHASLPYGRAASPASTYLGELALQPSSRIPTAIFRCGQEYRGWI